MTYLADFSQDFHARRRLSRRGLLRERHRAPNLDRISSVPHFQGSVRWMSVPTLPHLNGPRARGFACKPLQHEACASSLSHAHSLAQQPTRSSAYTVPGRARDSHPHSLKRARSSPTPASCPTQPSLPITPEFYHDSYTHAQKRPRHSSAAPTHAAVGTFCFPRSKSRQRKRIRKFCDIAPEKSRICHIRAPF